MMPRSPSASCAALLLTIGGGCDGAPVGERASPAHRLESAAATQQAHKLDRQVPGSANQVPALAGTSGVLGYRPNCLFLDPGGGEEIGLVVPAEVIFDGRRMIGKLPAPTGRPIVREVGQLVSVSGPSIDNLKDGRYGCDTERVLIADQF